MIARKSPYRSSRHGVFSTILLTLVAIGLTEWVTYLLWPDQSEWLFVILVAIIILSFIIMASIVARFISRLKQGQLTQMPTEILFVMLLVPIIIVYIIFMSDQVSLIWVNQFGVVTQGVVTNLESRPGQSVKNNFAPDYFLTYQFTIFDSSGQEISLTKTQNISRDIYDKTSIGKEVPIKYLTSNPERSFFEDETLLENAVSNVLLPFLWLFMVLIGNVIRRKLRQFRLQAHEGETNAQHF